MASLSITGITIINNSHASSLSKFQTKHALNTINNQLIILKRYRTPKTVPEKIITTKNNFRSDMFRHFPFMRTRILTESEIENIAQRVKEKANELLIWKLVQSA